MRTVEFACQYSDQVRKKHKAWHDGKLKLVESAKRLMLYGEDDKKLLSSTIMTSERELQRILDPDEFGATEHHIFGRYMVIICERIGEQEEPTTATDPPKMVKRPLPPRTVLKSTIAGRGGPLALKMPPVTAERPLVKLPSRTVLKSTGHGDPLALKMNRPFKPPRTTTQTNRPSVRPSLRRVVKAEPQPTKARARIRRVKHQPIML